MALPRPASAEDSAEREILIGTMRLGGPSARPDHDAAHIPGALEPWEKAEWLGSPARNPPSHGVTRAAMMSTQPMIRH